MQQKPTGRRVPEPPALPPDHPWLQLWHGKALYKGGHAMYLVKILNADHRPVDVEVSLEIYRVYEESRKQEERQRYERRKHIEGRSFDDCLMFDLATEPLEDTVERLETLLEIGQVLEKLPPLQRWRFILHFFYGYSYSEIAKMQDCNKSACSRL